MTMTPGPWTIDESKYHELYVRGAKTNGIGGRLAVAKVTSTGHDKGEWRANARLIAAAPEMFSWIQKMQQFQYLNDAEKVALFAAARALLAKIEGDAFEPEVTP